MDVGIDRRAFLSRVSVAAALGAAGSVALPKVGWAAAPVRSQADPAAMEVRPEALSDVTELTIAEAAALFRRGKLTPEQLVEAYLDRIFAFDATYQAFNLVLAEEALAAARATGSRPRGPSALQGIPLAIKDNYFTAGVLTTANSYLFQDFAPPFDATAIARLKEAGGIVLGKTQMGPLATTRATTPDGRITTVNAWTPANPATNPGGGPHPGRRPRWQDGWRPPASAPRRGGRSRHRPTLKTSPASSRRWVACPSMGSSP